MSSGTFVGNILGGAGDIVSDVFEGAGNLVSDAFNYVTENPLQALAIGLGGYGLYNMLGTAAAAGATEAGLLGADAAQLAAQGLSEAQIAETLGYAGADAFAAADAAQLALQGLNASQIESILAQQTLSPFSADIAAPLLSDAAAAAAAGSSALSIKDALAGANLLRSMTGGQSPTGIPAGLYGQAGGGLSGSVDYRSTLGLLNPQVQGTGLLGTQFNPGSPDISSFLAMQKLNNISG